MAGLLRRRPATAQPDAARPDDPPPAGTAPPHAKGRPTPTRAQARQARRSASRAPSDPKKGAGSRKEERRERLARERAAMRSGDLRALPERERVPERVFVRDLVDARRSLVTLMLPLVVLYFIGLFVPFLAVRVAAYYVLLIGFLLVAGDTIVLTRYVRRRVEERFPGSRVPVRYYAWQRAAVLRRFRLPRPRVTPGQQV